MASRKTAQWSLGLLQDEAVVIASNATLNTRAAGKIAWTLGRNIWVCSSVVGDVEIQAAINA